MMDAIVLEPPRSLRRRMAEKHRKSAPIEAEEFVVCTAPWGEYESFPTSQKAKKFLRRHSREIAERFNY